MIQSSQEPKTADMACVCQGIVQAISAINQRFTFSTCAISTPAKGGEIGDRKLFKCDLARFGDVEAPCRHLP